MWDQSDEPSTSQYEGRLPMVAPAPLVPIKRRRGRPRKHHGQVKFRKPSRCSKSSWSDKTKKYVRNLSAGKGVKGQSWSTLEKKRLLRGLQQYSHQDWDSLCRAIPSRTKKEIQDYIHTLRGGEHCKIKAKEDDHLNWAPIESWLDMCSEMVHYEQLDLSNVLGRVFSTHGHFGNFPATDGVASGLVPDYGKLYRYIAAIMDESLSIPELSPLESAVMSDLMYGMGDVLRMCDNSLQRKVMCWKYKMLNYKFEFDDVKASLDRIRKALTNDFSDLVKDTNRSVSGLPSFNQTSASSTPPSALEVPASSSTAPSAGLNPEAAQPSTSGSSQASGSKEDDPPKQKKKGRKRLRDWRRPIEKPRLFTMNPFCVPIRLLRLKPLPTKPVRDEDISLPGSSRRRSMSVSSVQSVASDTSHVSLEKSIQSQASQAEDRNNIRQMTGLFEPAMARKNKKRSLIQAQASASTMSAIAASLAKRITNTASYSEVPVGLQSTAVGNQAQNPSSPPKQAFRCVRLPGDKMALIPAHLNDPALLSSLPMREALPSHTFTQPLSRPPSVPALRHQSQPAGSSLNSHPAAATASDAATSSGSAAPGVRKMPPLKPSPAAQAATVQSSHQDRKRTHSAAQLESTNGVSAPVSEVSTPAENTAEADSQSQEARPVYKYAQILSSRRPPKKAVTPVNRITVTEIMVSPSATGQTSQSTVISKTVLPESSVTLPQKKTSSFPKVSNQSASKEKDEKPKLKGKPKQNGKSKLDGEAKQGGTTKQDGKSKQAGKVKGKGKPKQPRKAGKTLLAKALTSAQPVDASSVTSTSTTTKSKPAGVSSKAPQNSAAGTSDLSSTAQPDRPIASRPCENGGHTNLDSNHPSRTESPSPKKRRLLQAVQNSYFSVSNVSRSGPQKTQDNSNSAGVSSVSLPRPKNSGDNSSSAPVTSASQSTYNEERNHVKDPESSGGQSEGEASGVELSSSRHGRIRKPSFKASLAQGASPGASPKKKVKSVSFDKNVKTLSMDCEQSSTVRTNSEQSVPSESSTRPQSQALDLSKNSVGKQGPDPDPKPSTSSQNRKKKNKSETSQSKPNIAPNSSPRKKTKNTKKGEKEKPRKLHQKRPNNFLANEDISNMKVEVVTPEEAKRRMLEPGVKGRKPTLVELNNAPKSLENDTVPMIII